MGLTDHDFSDPDISNRIRNTSTVYELDPEPTKKFGFPTLDTVHYKKCKKVIISSLYFIHKKERHSSIQPSPQEVLCGQQAGPIRDCIKIYKLK